MTELNQLYQQTIDAQRTHLTELQAQFNTRCDDAKAKALGRLKGVPEQDKEGRQAILMDEKKELQDALNWLKTEVNESTRVTMKKLEEIQKQREQSILADLEKQIAAL